MITCMPSRNEVTQLTITGEWSTAKIHEVWKSNQLAFRVLFVHCFLFILSPPIDAFISNLEDVIKHTILCPILWLGTDGSGHIFLILVVSLSL